MIEAALCGCTKYLSSGVKSVEIEWVVVEKTKDEVDLKRVCVTQVITSLLL